MICEIADDLTINELSDFYEQNKHIIRSINLGGKENGTNY